MSCILRWKAWKVCSSETTVEIYQVRMIPLFVHSDRRLIINFSLFTVQRRSTQLRLNNKKVQLKTRRLFSSMKAMKIVCAFVCVCVCRCVCVGVCVFVCILCWCVRMVFDLTGKRLWMFYLSLFCSVLKTTT